jgi:L-ascorbate metabolism protein UlaG (beta-lactamase superfamily)
MAGGSSSPKAWPKRVHDTNFPPPHRTPHDRISATYIGHSTFLLQIGGLCVLTDPIWSDRCSPVSFAGPRRVRQPGQSLDGLPGVDLLLVSHNHYDHMDLPTLRKVQERWAPCAVTGLGNARHLAKAGIRSAVELDWWHTIKCVGARVTYVPAQHFSSRGPHDRNRCLWGGFVVEAQGAVVYFAGDSGYCPHFVKIGRRFRALPVRRSRRSPLQMRASIEFRHYPSASSSSDRRRPVCDVRTHLSG